MTHAEAALCLCQCVIESCPTSIFLSLSRRFNWMFSPKNQHSFLSLFPHLQKNVVNLKFHKVFNLNLCSEVCVCVFLPFAEDLYSE